MDFIVRKNCWLRDDKGASARVIGDTVSFRDPKAASNLVLQGLVAAKIQPAGGLQASGGSEPTASVEEPVSDEISGHSGDVPDEAPRTRRHRKADDE